MCSSPDPLGSYSATHQISDNVLRSTTPAPVDVVNNPPHYTFGEIECIDAIKAALGKEQFIGYLRGACMKYIWRLGHKDSSLEQAKKTRWYVERLIKELADAS